MPQEKHESGRPSTKKSLAILKVIAKHRRVLPEEDKSACETYFCDSLVQKVEAFVIKEQPIRIVMPSFPVKSAVRTKTLGDHADMAEQVSLHHLNSICVEIGLIYEPGAKMVLYSDAFAFRGALPDVYFEDARTTRYIEEVQEIIDSAKMHIEIINLDGKVDLMPYAEPLEAFAERIKHPKTPQDENSLALYKGQRQFLLHELEELGYKTGGKKSFEKLVGARAKGVALMSAALSKCLNELEPDAVRVSCHPKSLAGEKMGIWLNPDHSASGTPWHNAIAFLMREEHCSSTFLKASEALARGFVLMHCHRGRPSHFVEPRVHASACVIQRFFKQVVQQKTSAQEALATAATALPTAAADVPSAAMPKSGADVPASEEPTFSLKKS